MEVSSNSETLSLWAFSLVSFAALSIGGGHLLRVGVLTSELGMVQLNLVLLPSEKSDHLTSEELNLALHMSEKSDYLTSEELNLVLQPSDYYYSEYPLPSISEASSEVTSQDKPPIFNACLIVLGATLILLSLPHLLHICLVLYGLICWSEEIEFKRGIKILFGVFCCLTGFILGSGSFFLAWFETAVAVREENRPLPSLPFVSVTLFLLSILHLATAFVLYIRINNHMKSDNFEEPNSTKGIENEAMEMEEEVMRPRIPAITIYLADD